MTMTKAQREEQTHARDSLLAILKPGDTVYTVLRHTSRSGMSRAIDCYVIQDSEPRWISRYVAQVTGSRFSDRYDAVEVGGCGMDMGFGLVYSLSRKLWPDGFACLAPMVYLFDDEIREGQYPHIGGYESRDIGYGVETGEIDPTPLSERDGSGKRMYRVWDHDCPSNDHSNREHKAWHESGGYALRQRWM